MRIAIAMALVVASSSGGRAETCNPNIQGTAFTNTRNYDLLAHDGRLLQCRPDIPTNAAIRKIDTDMTAAMASAAALALPSYVTIGGTPTLSNERSLGVTNPLKLTDGGANNIVSIGADYSQGLASNPILNSGECMFTSTPAGGILCEGGTPDNAEALLFFQDPAADVTITVPTSINTTLVGTTTTDSLSNKTLLAFTVNGLMTFADTRNIVFNTATGTQIGTATNQKFAFYGNTPVVQQAGTVDMRTVMSTYGFMAAGGPTPLDLLGGALGSGTQTYTDGANQVFGTVTGTRIGTSTSQKIGFFNATPIVQPSNVTDLRTALINLGLYATGGASPLNLNGGALTVGSETIAEGGNVTLGTATGTIIGAATNQKLAFYGNTPIVQPSLNTDIRTLLINLGLVASGGANPLSTNGGAINTGAGTLTVGTNGGAVAAILKGSTTQDMPSTAAGACNNLPSTFTVTGAADGDTCMVGVTNAAMTAGTTPGGTFQCWVTAANTVQIKLCCEVGTCDPASATYKVTIVQ